MFDKEDIYDNEIAPLMQQILEICKREDLPMTAQFYLKQERDDSEYDSQAMFCTSLVIPEKEKIIEEHRDHLFHVAEAMKYGPQGKPFFSAMTITSDRFE